MLQFALVDGLRLSQVQSNQQNCLWSQSAHNRATYLSSYCKLGLTNYLAKQWKVVSATAIGRDKLHCGGAAASHNDLGTVG
jgi:hypothetical protein